MFYQAFPDVFVVASAAEWSAEIFGSVRRMSLLKRNQSGGGVPSTFDTHMGERPFSRAPKNDMVDVLTEVFRSSFLLHAASMCAFVHMVRNIFDISGMRIEPKS